MNTEQTCPGSLKLTETELAFLRNLRERGCAVCVFLPHEIGDASLEDVEERMCKSGWDEINLTGNVGLTV